MMGSLASAFASPGRLDAAERVAATAARVVVRGGRIGGCASPGWRRVVPGARPPRTRTALVPPLVASERER